MAFLGIDVGSLTCDAVLIDEDAHTLAWSVVPTGARNLQAIERARSEVLRQADAQPGQIKAVVSTGYGRDRVEERLAAVTEITCHARGIHHLLPETNVLLDIGGQDSKAIHLAQQGQVMEFAMNDKCAAGTGRFLEAMARALELDLDQLGELDAKAHSSLSLSSICTVFAESEVVSLIAEGAEVADIVRGLHNSIANRTQSLVKRVAPSLNEMRIAMSGGVARNPGVVRALRELLGCPISVPEQPDIIGALGAALIARKKTIA